MSLTGDYVPGTWEGSVKQVERYESSGGAKGNTSGGKPVVILTMIGAKTGKIRKTPVMRVEHEGVYAVVGSVGGAAKHPDWYFNLLANPQVELQDGPTPRPFVAHLTTGPERELWWARAVAAFDYYATYQRKTKRTLPVFVLEPAD